VTKIVKLAQNLSLLNIMYQSHLVLLTL